MPRFRSWLQRRAAAKSDLTATAPVLKRPMGRYVAALFLIGLLAVISTLVARQAFSEKAQDATVLEYGLRQGFLAGRVTDLSYLAVNGLTQTQGLEFSESVDEISRVHAAFIAGSSELDLPTMSGSDADVYLVEAGSSLDAMLAAADRIQYAVDVGGMPPKAAAESVEEASVEYSVAMQRVVASYLRSSGEQKLSMEQVEYLLLMVTLGVLVFEGLFLFRPAARRVQKSWNAHSEAHRSERELDQQRLNYLARYDSLTGLINRTLFSDRLESAVARARREGSVVALMFLDLDGFKEVNDRLGHAVGDALLRQAAERIVASVRETDTVARLGGDEFTVILEGGQRVEDAGQVATKILRRLATPYRVGGEDIVITSSMGIAAYPLDGETTEDLLKGADIAMYSAKDAGRNTYEFYTTELRERTSQRLTLLDGLRKAIEADEGLYLHYQPKVDTARQMVIGVEALIRWEHPELGKIPTEKFIRMAEETDLIVPLGQWVLDTACLQMRSWLDAGLPPMRISVNLSARQFRAGNLVETVVASLAAARLNPRFLDVELTEGTLLTDLEETRRALERLRDVGVTVSIDDFGTGYSSLGYLTQLPIDTLKIDRSFIADGMTSRDGIAVSSAIIGLARTLRLDVIAEGVENEEQLAFLSDLGCDRIQGFLISRPIPGDQILNFVSEYVGETASIGGSR